MPAKLQPNELRLIRLYDAPVKSVWKAWTNLDAVAQWWGPRGFTLTTHSKDLRVGGHWNYTMHGPDGVDYPNKTTYFEVIENSRLVYDHGASEDRPPMFRVTALFAEIKGQTQLVMTMAFESPEVAEQTRIFIKKAGGDATWDRLAEFLAKESLGKDQFVINRSFACPRELMFELWTNPLKLSQWLAPTGSTMKFKISNITPGGTSFYEMGDGKTTLYGKSHYIEIEKPSYLTYTQQFCDKNDRVSRHPMAPTWPETMLTHVVFAEEGPTQSRVTVTWEPYGAATAEEVMTFINSRAGMTMGWTGSFDNLEAFISEQS